MMKPSSGQTLSCLRLSCFAPVVFITLSACAPYQGAPPQAPLNQQLPLPTPLTPRSPVPPTAPAKPVRPKPSTKPNPSATPRQTSPKPSSLPAQKPIEKSAIKQAYYRSAVWGKVANTEKWTETVLKSTRYYRDSLERARDLEDFCPGYNQVSKRQQDICWLRLISAVVKYESAFNPRHRFLEPMGQYSVGLMQLSDGECILNDDRHPDLEDPLKNLKCGIAIMARLIRRHEYIDGPLWGRGAAAYWSTLRKPYVFLGMRLGKKNQVAKYSRTYASF